MSRSLVALCSAFFVVALVSASTFVVPVEVIAQGKDRDKDASDQEDAGSHDLITVRSLAEYKALPKDAKAVKCIASTAMKLAYVYECKEIEHLDGRASSSRFG